MLIRPFPVNLKSYARLTGIARIALAPDPITGFLKEDSAIKNDTGLLTLAIINIGSTN